MKPTVILTPKGKQVLLLIAQGLSSRQIARRMGLAWQTVSNHRHRLNLVLRTNGPNGRNSMNLVRAAIKAGVLDTKDLK